MTASTEDRTACILATLGMFIIDTFSYNIKEGHTAPAKMHPAQSVGGGGLFLVQGARIWLHDGQALMIIDRGSDWPDEVQAQLDVYRNQKSFHYRDDASRLTTRALNSYNSDAPEQRGFKYLTPRARLTAKDLVDTPGVDLPPTYIHAISTCSRAADLVQEMQDMDWLPTLKLCFEPLPDLCIPSELDNLKKVLCDVNIFSPNHTEAAAFFGEELIEPEQGAIERLARRCLDLGAKDIVIIRSGAMGVCGVRRSEPDRLIWVPAYHQTQEDVVDSTGGGNSFLGGLLAGMHLHQEDLQKAMICGCVSASYIIEQFGLPALTLIDGEGRQEIWNAPSRQPEERFAQLQARIQQS